MSAEIIDLQAELKAQTGHLEVSSCARPLTFLGGRKLNSLIPLTDGEREDLGTTEPSNFP